MRLIFIYGLPATGKLTVAQELARRTGYRLFHNHLVVDLLLSTFEFGSAPFVELRESIWLSIFDHASRSALHGLIFTFNPETTVRPQFVQQAVDTVIANNGQVDFVELVCPLDEIKRRIHNPSRLEHRKLSSPALFERLHAAGEFETAHMPSPRLTIDTGRSDPVQAAFEICKTLNLASATDGSGPL
jgi:deoxyadenosine/deoxycytidine kinase